LLVFRIGRLLHPEEQFLLDVLLELQH
jgi:hypothetical protein